MTVIKQKIEGFEDCYLLTQFEIIYNKHHDSYQNYGKSSFIYDQGDKFIEYSPESNYIGTYTKFSKDKHASDKRHHVYSDYVYQSHFGSCNSSKSEELATLLSKGNLQELFSIMKDYLEL